MPETYPKLAPRRLPVWSKAGPGSEARVPAPPSGHSSGPPSDQRLLFRGRRCVSSYEVQHHTSPTCLELRARAATALFHGTHSRFQSSLLLSRGLSCKTTFSKEL